MTTHDDEPSHPAPSPPKETAKDQKSSVMRSLGQSVGILWRAIRTPVGSDDDQPQREIVDTEVREHTEGDVTYRETTVREIEYRRSSKRPGQPDHTVNPSRPAGTEPSQDETP